MVKATIVQTKNYWKVGLPGTFGYIYLSKATYPKEPVVEITIS